MAIRLVPEAKFDEKLFCVSFTLALPVVVIEPSTLYCRCHEFLVLVPLLYNYLVQTQF